MAVKPRNTYEEGVVAFLFPSNCKRHFEQQFDFFFHILASLCFHLYLVLLKPEQIFKIVNEETSHGEAEVHVPSSKTSELSEPEVFFSSLYT